MASKAIGFLNFKFSADLSSFERAMNKAQKKLKKFGKSVTKTGQNLSRNLTLPILGLGAAALKFGSDFEETDAKFKTVFSSIQKEAEKTAQSLKENFGLSELAAKEMLSGTGDLLVGFGFTEKKALELSNSVNELAVDLASFTNFSGGAKGASEALTKALLGERESIKSLGIAITETDLKKYAADQGLVWKELDRVAKATLTFEMAQKQSSKAIGDFERTSGSFANQMRILQGDLVDIASEMGARLIPYAQVVIEKFKGLVVWFDNLSASTKDNIVKWGLILAAIGPVLIIIGKVSIGLGSLVGAFKSVGVFLAASPWLTAAAAITAVGYAIYDTFIATNELITAQDDLDSIAKTAQSSIMDEKVAVDLLTKELTAQGLSLEDKKIALDKLKKISPEYYGSLEIAKGKVEGLDQATKDYTASILQQAKAEAMKQKLVELNIELLESEEKMQKFLATTGGMFGADLKGSDIEKRALKALKESKQHMQDRIDALSKEYSITKKIGDLTTSKTTTTTTTTPTGDKGGANGGVGKKVEQMEALSLATHDTFEEISLLSHRLDGLEMPEGLFNTDPLEEYRGALGDLGEQMGNFFGKDIKELEQITHDAAMQIATNLAQGADSWEEYGQTIKNVIRDTIGSIISQAVMEAALSALTGVPFPFNIIAAGIAAGAARTAFNSMIPEFAEGGLVTGPTTALIGEYPGAASNPEVVAPLDKLKSMMGGGNQNIIVEGILRGNDIYLSNKNTSVNRLRTT